ncbi:phosphohydrolase [Leptospira tipperaryensis]|uniref:Phosphohydrolase n=1 Tax=Leptospira tipperaryensis TaxID=2564040 RepID=A0A1D7V3G8_9LEPT|nr:metallophosphoesterase [Leptospira tipperaryensis]AOP36387.1 phosphohydrolase [Leptospira tipperaryensis]
MKRMLSFLGIIVFTIGVDSLIIERYFVSFPEYEFESEKVTKDLDGYRIIVISDLHYGFLNPEFWIQWIVDRANAKEADLIVGLGDYVKKRNTNEELFKVWPILKELKAKDGVYLVNGNHDHWANNDLSLELLEKSERSLRNKNITINRNASRFIVAGIGDFWEDVTEFDAALSETSSDDLRIVLAHNPDSSNIKHKEKVDLFLTGHTHGGQVRVPIFNSSPILPVKDKNFDKGFKKNKFGENVFISSSIGWSILPIRLFCPSEVPIIILRSLKSQHSD